ncbi:MAG TPA: hypothetical protein DGF10_00510 [Acidimicrobiaceae bacterium]|nr:hypothetical protein [Acidimicrobiaceae bacterium]
MTLAVLAVVVFLILANALFVATEFALVAGRRTRLEEAAKGGSRAAIRALRARKSLRLQMSGAQLGITASSIAVGILAESAIGGLLDVPLRLIGLRDGVLDTTSWVSAIVVAAFCQMLLGEMVPKNLAIAQPERTLRWTIGLHAAFVAAARPLVLVLDRAATLLVRPFGLTPVDEVERAVGVPELASMLHASHDQKLIEDFEHDLLAGVLDLGRLTVASVMVPKDEVVTVGNWESVSEVERVVEESGLSRIPLLEGDGAVRRFVHARRLLVLPSEAQGEPLTMESTRPLAVLGPHLPLDDALHTLRGWRQRLAVVRADGDSPDRWQGIVSIEDVLERLVGDIRDETEEVDGRNGTVATPG